MSCLNTLEALQITTAKVKEYVDEKPVVSYEESQALGAASRTIAKSNIGVYVSTSEPADALDGDIWVDTDEVQSELTYTYSTEDLIAGESALKTGTLYFVYE